MTRLLVRGQTASPLQAQGQRQDDRVLMIEAILKGSRAWGAVAPERMKMDAAACGVKAEDLWSRIEPEGQSGLDIVSNPKLLQSKRARTAD